MQEIIYAKLIGYVEHAYLVAEGRVDIDKALMLSCLEVCRDNLLVTGTDII